MTYNELYNKGERGNARQVAQAELAIKQDALRNLRKEEDQLKREIARLKQFLQTGEQTGE